MVNKVLIAEDVYYPGDSEPEEYYMSVLLDRASGKNMIMYSPQGGMDIEAVAEETPELIAGPSKHERQKYENAARQQRRAGDPRHRGLQQPQVHEEVERRVQRVGDDEDALLLRAQDVWFSRVEQR